MQNLKRLQNPLKRNSLNKGIVGSNPTLSAINLIFSILKRGVKIGLVANEMKKLLAGIINISTNNILSNKRALEYVGFYTFIIDEYKNIEKEVESFKLNI